jgi:hypothetical protein
VSLHFRPLVPTDQDRLWHWLHVALWDPPPAPPRRCRPRRRRGLGEPLMRAALQAARERGVRQVALTVHPQNPAVGLYERCGFVKQGLRGSYHLMVAPLAQAF